MRDEFYEEFIKKMDINICKIEKELIKTKTELENYKELVSKFNNIIDKLNNLNSAKIPLNLNLTGVNSFWINGSDKIFEDTDFYGMDFFVKIKPITKSQIRRFREESTSSKGVLDYMKLATLVFTECCIDWKNIEDGDSVLECTESNKRVVDEKFPTFTAIISNCCVFNNKQQSEKLEDEKKA